MRARFLLLLFTAFSFEAAAAGLPELTLAPRSATLRLVVAGDVGLGTERIAHGIATLHTEKPFDAIVLLGDNIYPCGVRSGSDPRWKVLTPLTQLGIPIYPVLGNHDYCGTPEAQVGAPIPNWRFPAREYLLRAGPADFVMLDTTPLADGKARASDLAIGSLAKSRAAWRIAAGHHTIVASGAHTMVRRPARERMRTLIEPMRAAGIDFYLCGHDHHQELIDDDPRYLISGAGSDPIPPIVLRPSTRYPPEIRRERYGFAVLELSTERASVTFYDHRGSVLGGPFRYPSRSRAR